ncbi:MAG TPA: 30S ribosomal protein S27ae [Methanomassiliicoccales archaeon]|nr:30S ribosomal protein S27ae [Methanomassiliicoccales archaeon]HNX47202.1 30S ribosomal protein S27ae [Methanomassiliicoccales archaeon]HPR97978.1 30S ribosomal protein S27ae [Methanomassiliicoccales archaeon]HSA34987.1 30S ribosomal protein S27ae [Methanomassiliicoccales archaeon]
MAAPKKKEVKKEAPSAKKDYYQAKGEKLERLKKSCPKCGPGVFMGEHKDRTSCGKCGYTEFKKK